MTEDIVDGIVAGAISAAGPTPIEYQEVLAGFIKDVLEPPLAAREGSDADSSVMSDGITDPIVDPIVDKATSAIIAADLTPIEHQILVRFIKKAEEPPLAAQEVLDRICDNSRPVEETLRMLKSDWHNLVAVISRPTPVDAALKDLVCRRDQFRCCATPHDRQQVDAPEPTFIIPPVLSELGDVSALLDAFMTPSRASQLRSMLSDRSDLGRIVNTLLLTPSILRAFQNGHLRARPHWNTLDVDATNGVSKSKLPLPSPFLIETHNKFANALHKFYVEERIALGWGPLASPWESNYVQQFSGIVQQLPLGLYAKSYRGGEEAVYNESNALRLVEQHAPSIPAPLLIDNFRRAGVEWFIMTGLPGLRVLDVLHRMSYPERHQLATDLSKVITQMHKIPNNTPYRYGNVSGGPINDGRLNWSGTNSQFDFETNGPFNSEGDLNERLSRGFQFLMLPKVPLAYSRSHPSVFTHGDLYLSNVLVDGGRLSGVVDWESASFMPTYWEFTKAMRTTVSQGPAAEALYREIWGHEFDVELETERWIWNVFPFGG